VRCASTKHQYGNQYPHLDRVFPLQILLNQIQISLA